MWILAIGENTLYSLRQRNDYSRRSAEKPVNSFYLSSLKSFLDLAEVTGAIPIWKQHSLTKAVLTVLVHNEVYRRNMCCIVVRIYSYFFPMTNEKRTARFASSSGVLFSSTDSLLFVRMPKNATTESNDAFLSQTLECQLLVIQRPAAVHRVVHTVANVIGIVALLCYTVMITCVPTIANALSEVDTNLDSSITQDQVKGHCVDSNGTLRGLFSTWMEGPDCRCTCYPAARMAVSVCDGCIVVPPQVQTKLTDGISQREASTADLEKLFMQRKSIIANKSDCVYTQTGIRYQHSEIWMSAKVPCAKCRCEDGAINCAGQPHHCPPSCLPGQQTVSLGPCCEATCKGMALQNLTTNLASCIGAKAGVTHAHGDLVVFSGSCVDQKCQCVNGRWNCLDYCVPLAMLPCPPQSATVWDPFCCPRCQGTMKCMVPSFSGSIRNDTGQMNPQPVKLFTDNTNTFGHLQRASDESLHNTDKPDDGDTPIPTMLVVDPGAEVALKDGHCYCLNATIYCPRPGRHIWHDEDCYFVDGWEGTYYSPNATWIPNWDACTECRCVQKRQYVCEPKKCKQQFVCPKGEQPLRRDGECCPSFCGVRPKNVLDGISKPTPTQSWKAIGKQRPESIAKLPDQSPKSTSSPVSTKKPSEEETSSIKNGCPELGGSNDRHREIFPTGSRLILTRPCRSLLCSCASDYKWTCSDYCPPCGIDVEFMGTGNNFQIPLAGECCPRCSAGEVPMTHFHKESKTTDGKSTDERHGHRGSAGDRLHSGFLYPISGRHVRYEEDMHQTPYRIPIATSDQIERTLKLYVLIAAVVLFCLLGFPMTIFITWYAITRRRKRRHREYRVKLRRRRQQHTETMATAVRQHPSFARMMTEYRGFRTTSSSGPSTSSSRNETEPFTFAYDNPPSSARCTEICERQEGLYLNANKAIDRGQETAMYKESENGDAKSTPMINKKSGETKSVPSSPVSRFTTRPKPRRVKSTIKDNRFANALYKQKVESTSHFDSRCLLHTEDDDQQNVQPSVSTKIIPPRENKMQTSSKVSVRRALSSVVARQITFDQSEGAKLNRASTWLPGVQISSQKFGHLTRQMTVRSDGKRDSDVPLNRSGPVKVKSGVSLENGSADSLREDRQKKNEKIDTVVQTTGSRVMVFANNKHRARSNSQVRIIRPDTLLRSILRAQTVSEGKEYVRYTNRPLNATSPQVMSQTNGLGETVVKNDSNVSKSPETENTSMTDSQSPLVLTDKTPIVAEMEGEKLQSSLAIMRRSESRDMLQKTHQAVEEGVHRITSLHHKGEHQPVETKLTETCYTWPRPRTSNNDSLEYQTQECTSKYSLILSTRGMPELTDY